MQEQALNPLRRKGAWLCRAAVLLTAAMLACAPGAADEAAPGKTSEERAAATSRALPAETITNHAIMLGAEKLAFTARAGAIQLRDPSSNATQAEIAYISYERAGVDAATRPVAFVFNGGPGASSAWLGLGALSPWRLRLGADFAPSDPPVLADNAESWLGFADLVLIDPPGTGYSRIVGEGEDLRKRLYSVHGDAEALAVALRKWLTAHKRLASPKFIVGESYGAFRAVKLLHALRERESVGVNGLLLVSPVLDFGWLAGSRNPLADAVYLPSFAAVARDATERSAVADVEAYAAGPYVADLLKGVKDKDALDRLAENVGRIAGLDRAVTARLGGRLDVKTFARERRRDAQKVLSAYDGKIAGFDPAPFSSENEWADPVLDALRAPLGEAMIRLTTEKLEWRVGEARYEILNSPIARQWDYGRGGRVNAEAISDLREALALDPRLRALVVHGIADLVTPYFATKLLLDQIPAFGDGGRVELAVVPGGHMPYLREESRRAFRDAARKLFDAR